MHTEGEILNTSGPTPSLDRLQTFGNLDGWITERSDSGRVLLFSETKRIDQSQFLASVHENGHISVTVVSKQPTASTLRKWGSLLTEISRTVAPR